MTKPRNYRKEYDDFHALPEQRARRAARNKSRAIVEKKKGKAAIAGKDVDHKNHNAKDTRMCNLRVRSVHANRADNTHKKK